MKHLLSQYLAPRHMYVRSHWELETLWQSDFFQSISVENIKRKRLLWSQLSLTTWLRPLQAGLIFWELFLWNCIWGWRVELRLMGRNDSPAFPSFHFYLSKDEWTNGFLSFAKKKRKIQKENKKQTRTKQKQNKTKTKRCNC